MTQAKSSSTIPSIAITILHLTLIFLAYIILAAAFAGEVFGQEAKHKAGTWRRDRTKQEIKSSDTLFTIKSSQHLGWARGYSSSVIIEVKAGDLTLAPNESDVCTVKSQYKAMRMVLVMAMGNWPHDEWNPDKPRIKWLRTVLANCDKEVAK